MAAKSNIFIFTGLLLVCSFLVNAMPGNTYPKKVPIQRNPTFADFLVDEDDSQFQEQPRFVYLPRYASENDDAVKKPVVDRKFKRAAAYSSSGTGAGVNVASGTFNGAGAYPFGGFNPYTTNFAYPFDFNSFFSNLFSNIPQYSNFPANGVGNTAFTSAGIGGNGIGLSTRFGPVASGGPGFNGVFSSSHSGFSNNNGKVHSFKEATTGYNDNGKITFYTVRDP